MREVRRSNIIYYKTLVRRLKRKGLNIVKLRESRQYFATFMVRNGLIREEVDLPQGRIPPNIFVRHYRDPSFKELRDRTLKAVADLVKTL